MNSVLLRRNHSIRRNSEPASQRRRPASSSRQLHLDGVERLDGRQMLAADASASIYNDIYEAYTNSAAVRGAVTTGMPSANYWSDVSSINGQPVVAANGQPGLASLNVFNGANGVFVETLGYSMILASLYDDKATFDRLSATVQVAAGHNNDHPGLVPWAMALTSGTESSWTYSDSNSAADGDVNIALAYVYADKAASVYGWSDTPDQGGSSYHELALNYISAIREQDFAQDDPNIANRYLLAEGAIQTGNLGGDGQYYGGFQDNLWHYDYSDLRGFELFAEYDPTPSAYDSTKTFWAQALGVTVDAYKAIFYFGSQDTGREEAVVQGAIDPTAQYVKLSNNSYQAMQASFDGYKSFAMERDTDTHGNAWDVYTADCQRFPIRLSNYLNAHVDDQDTATSPEWQIGLTNLQSLGASFTGSYSSAGNDYTRYTLTDQLFITPDTYANATSYSGVVSYNAAGLLALTENPTLQELYKNDQTITTVNTYLDTYFGYYLTPTNDVPTDWGGFSTSQPVYGPNQIGFHGQWPTAWNLPDAFQDSLTLWGLTVSQNGWTPLQEYVTTGITTSEYTVSNGVITEYTGGTTAAAAARTLQPIGAKAFSGSAPTSITIPGHIRGQKIIGIGPRAFFGCSLTSITIPDSVKSIGDYAFANSAQLESVTWSDHAALVSIGVGAFRGATSLTSITIPDSVKTIGEYAFANATALTTVVIGNHLTRISDWAFQGTSLTSVTIPNTVTDVGIGAFYGSNRLASVSIGNHVRRIGAWAFHGTSLTSLMIPNSVTRIDRGAFSNIKTLTNVQLGTRVAIIGMDAFAGDRTLSSVTFKGKAPSVGSRAFAGLASTANAYRAEGLTGFGKNGAKFHGLTVKLPVRPK